MSRGRFALGAALIMLTAAATPAAARETIGVYKAWASFRDQRPDRCYAIAAPIVSGGSAFASVSSWPRRRVAGQLHFRLYRAARAGSAILLNVDGQVFQLVGRGADAWAPDRSADRAIVAAMRTGVTMAISARDERGAGLTHAFALNGAATAIDAAALACARG